MDKLKWLAGGSGGEQPCLHRRVSAVGAVGVRIGLAKQDGGGRENKSSMLVLSQGRVSVVVGAWRKQRRWRVVMIA
jgi:hypothetical protein